MMPSPMRRIIPVKDKGVPQRLGKVFDFSKIRIITGFFPGQYSVHGVMKVVAPLRIELKTAAFA